jgi:hypothetical protein
MIYQHELDTIWIISVSFGWLSQLPYKHYLCESQNKDAVRPDCAGEIWIRVSSLA